jgi:hypothetical protein
VFLGCNTNQNVCDFKVEGSLFNKSCTIYAQDGTTTVAKVNNGGACCLFYGLNSLFVYFGKN